VAGPIVKRAMELGINLIDTAEFYGFGRSELIVGEAIRDRRDDVFVATKIFPIGLPFMVPARARGSARRLGVDRIDLYQLHWPSPLFPPRATMPRFKRLVDGGLVAHAGVSNHSLAQWQACEDAFGGPVLSNQVRFSLVERGPEREVVPWAQRSGRIVIAYSPLGQGLLSGKYQAAPPQNFRRMRSDFSAESRARREPLVAALREIAARHQATPAQVALAWLVAKPNVVAIPGASSLRQLEENAAAGDLELESEDVRQLDSLS
jgi:aryl-alcohol dehydrogenase-like predicted oxidoreductase